MCAIADDGVGGGAHRCGQQQPLRLCQRLRVIAQPLRQAFLHFRPERTQLIDKLFPAHGVPPEFAASVAAFVATVSRLARIEFRASMKHKAAARQQDVDTTASAWRRESGPPSASLNMPTPKGPSP